MAIARFKYMGAPKPEERPIVVMLLSGRHNDYHEGELLFGGALVGTF